MLYDVDGHVRDSLGLYAMGALSESQASEVEAHLSQCELCQNDGSELQEIAVAFALISAEEAEDIVASSANDGRRYERTMPAPARPSGREQPHSRRPSTGVRPGSDRPAATARSPRRWRRSLQNVMVHTRVLVAAGLFALVVGFTVGLALKGFGEAPAEAAAAYADDQATGVTLSVNAFGRDAQTSIRAMVDGLPAGHTYRLFVVTADGMSHLVEQWVSTAGERTIERDVAVPIGSLEYFAVVDIEGRPVLLARVNFGPASTG